MMSPRASRRCEGRGLPNTIAGAAIGVEPMIRKSMSPPPSRMAAPAARSSYSGTPGLARATIASMARWHSMPALRTQAQLLLAVHDHQLVHEAVGEHQLGVREALAQHVVLVDRQVVVVPGIDLDQPDAAALEPLLEALDHDLGIAAVAAVPDVALAHSRRQASA